MPRLIAIGDIHGCAAALRSVVAAIDPGPDDILVPLGDYVDRGLDSRGVLDQLLELEGRCRLRPILGNHEEMMLSTIRGRAPAGWWLQHGGADTLDSYQFVGDLGCVPDEHLALLDRCLDFFETEEWFFTHANYVASEPLDAQPAEALRWQSLYEHLPGPHVSGKTAVVGHTAQRSGRVLDRGHLLCIDTHCYGGGWLTALEVQTRQLWQARPDGTLRVADDR